MRLVILEVLSNPLLWGVGNLTADIAPVVGNLTPRFVESPVFPHLPRGGGGGGMKLTSALGWSCCSSSWVEGSAIRAG